MMTDRRKMRISAILTLIFMIISLLSPAISAAAEPTNLALNKPVTSSDGANFNPDHAPAKAVDGAPISFTNGWDSRSQNEGIAPWLQVDLGDAYIITRVEYDDRITDGWIEYRANFEFQASNDPTFTDKVVLGGVGSEGFADDTTWGLDIVNSTPYRYIRWQKTIVQYVYLSEIRVFGVEAPADSAVPLWPDGSELTASNITDNSATLSWDSASDDAGVTGYRIYNGEELVETVAGDVTTCDGIELNIGRNIFKVEAGDEAGNWSDNGPSKTIVVPGPNIALNKPVTSSDTEISETHGPDKAVDGIGDQFGNGWDSKSSLTMSGAWLQIDLEQPYMIHWIEMDDRVGDSWDGPRNNFLFRASNDPEFNTYVDLANPVTTAFPDDTTWASVVTDTNAYRYVRFVKTIQSYQFIPEIRVYGVVEETEDTTAPQWPDQGELEASEISESGLTLTWPAATDDIAVTGYNIYKDSVLIDTLTAVVNTYNVTGLTPESEFDFTVEAFDAAGNVSSVLAVAITTLTAEGPQLRLYVASDTHSAGHDAKVATMAQDAYETGSDALFVLGDLTNDGDPVQYNTLTATIAANAGTVPAYYTTGNHDVRFKPGGFEEARELFIEKTGMPDVYYDLWIRDYHVIVMAGEKDLQDAASISDTQFEWLEEKLAEGADASKPIFVFLHQPLTLLETQAQVDRLKEILNQYPQVIYTHGHTHSNINSSTNVKFAECTVLCDGAIARNPAQAVMFEVYTDRVDVVARNASVKSTLRTDIVTGPKVDWVNREINAIDSILESAVIGTEDGQYPIWAKTNIDNAVAGAEAYIAGVTTQNGLGNVYNLLRKAKNAFIASEIDSNQTPDAFTVRGTITDELEQPVIGTVVEIFKADALSTPVGSAITQADGSYELSQVSGNYVVKTKYYTESADVIIPFANVTEVDLVVDSSDLTDNTKPVWTLGSELTASVISPTEVQLEWDPAADNVEVTCYMIYLGTDLISVVTGNTYTAEGLIPNTDYTFTVKASDGSSNITNEVLTASATTLNDSEAPIWTDAELNSSEKTINSITLNWTEASDNNYVESYRIYNGSSLVATVDAETTSYKVTGLELETTYTFSVQAGDAFDNWSTDGPTLTEATPSDTLPPVWPDASLLGFNLKSTSITLEWTGAIDNTVVESYKVYANSNLIATVDASKTKFDVTGLIKGEKYTFTVQAGDTYGNWSTEGPSTTAVAGPNIALGKSYSSGEGDDYLIWNGMEFGPDKAFDDGPFEGQEGYWNGWSAETGLRNPAFPAWLQVDLHQQYKLNRIELVDRPNDPYTGERHRFEIQASNDPTFATYDTLLTVGASTIPNDSTYVLLVSDDKPYRYVRYQKSDNGYAFVTEIRVYGSAINTDTTSPTWPSGSELTESDLTAIGVSLTWTAASDDIAVAGYNIYNGTDLLDTVNGVTLSYEVTGLDAATAYTFRVEAVDEAGNQSTDGPVLAIVTLETMPFTFEIPVFKDANGDMLEHMVPLTDFRARTTITNNYDESGKVCFILALYAPDGTFKNLAYIEGQLSIGETYDFAAGFTLPSDIEGYYVKVFVWDSMDEMRPITDPFRFE